MAYGQDYAGYFKTRYHGLEDSGNGSDNSDGSAANFVELHCKRPPREGDELTQVRLINIRWLTSELKATFGTSLEVLQCNKTLMSYDRQCSKASMWSMSCCGSRLGVMPLR